MTEEKLRWIVVSDTEECPECAAFAGKLPGTLEQPDYPPDFRLDEEQVRKSLRDGFDRLLQEMEALPIEELPSS